MAARADRQALQIVSGRVWSGALSIALALSTGCSSAPIAYTPEEFEAKKATWIALFEQADEECKALDADLCARLNVVALDLVLDDGQDVLSIDSYTNLWKLEQDYRQQFGIQGNAYDDVPIPKTPSEIATNQAQQRANQEAQQAFWAQLLAARTHRRSSLGVAPHGGVPVYDASQCVGPIIMGQCHGSTIGPPQKTCHGTMLNGQCTGPMF